MQEQVNGVIHSTISFLFLEIIDILHFIISLTFHYSTTAPQQPSKPVGNKMGHL